MRSRRADRRSSPPAEPASTPDTPDAATGSASDEVVDLVDLVEYDDRRRLDIVVVTDLRFPGGTSSSLTEELVAADAGGYTVGVLHAASPRLGPSASVHPGLRRLLDDGIAHLLLPGEPVRAHLAIVKHPMVFAAPLGGPLPIDVDAVLVVAGQVPADRAGTYYDPVLVDGHIADALGHPATWAPVGPTVRAELHGVTVAQDDWSEVIDVDAWHPASTRDDAPADTPADAAPLEGPIDPRIVIGRHSRPDRLKWPDDPDQLRLLYPTDGSVRVRVLGGADAVGDVLGAIPASWELLPFGAIDAGEFLSGLDAFVYFHHTDLTEAFGRTILEALAADVPVVVPHHFEPTFGDACLYATPETALDTVRALVGDPDACREHLERARSIVRDRFSHQTHRDRLDRLVGVPAVEPPTRPAAPSYDLIPPNQRSSYTTTLVACLGAPVDEIEQLLVALDGHRRQVPAFVPVVVTTATRPPLAAKLGIETKVITSRRNWSDPSEAWPDYAQRRLRQLAAHYRVDNVVVADPQHPDAWVALQLPPPRRV